MRFHIHQAKFCSRATFSDCDSKGTSLRQEIGDKRWREKSVASRVGFCQLGSARDPSRCVSFWHHLAWDPSIEALCKTCVMPIQQWRDCRPKRYLGIKLRHIPLHRVRWAAIQDASWANRCRGPLSRSFFGWVQLRWSFGTMLHLHLLC